MLSVIRFTQTERAQTEFVPYRSGHSAAKRENPTEDPISTLIRDAEGGQGLSDAELLASAMGLLVAGHETTANMIGKIVAMLLADRGR